MGDGFEKYVPPPPPKPSSEALEKEKQEKKIKEDEYWKHNDTKWIIHELNMTFKYDTEFFKIPKMRNGKATGAQMKPFMVSSGLSKEILKKVWKLSDLDKDGKMGNEEFALCMFLMELAKKGEPLPDKLSDKPNYIPPSFRGKELVKTPPKKPKKINQRMQSMPPNMKLNGNNVGKVKIATKIQPKNGVNAIKIIPKTQSTVPFGVKPKNEINVQRKERSPSPSPSPSNKASPFGSVVNVKKVNDNKQTANSSPFGTK